MTIFAFPGGASIFADRAAVVILFMIQVQSHSFELVRKVEVYSAGVWQLSSGRACDIEV